MTLSSLSRKLTTHEIIQIFREIDQHPNRAAKLRSVLVRKLSHIPCSLVAKYSKLPNYNDLKQVAYETFYRAVLTFDYKKSSNFYGWSWWWVRKEVAIAARKEKEYVDSIVDFSPAYIDEKEQYDLEEDIIAAHKELLLKQLLLSLEERERYILSASLGLEGPSLSLRGIAGELSMSHEGVRKIQQKAIRRAKVLFLNAERSC